MSSTRLQNELLNSYLAYLESIQLFVLKTLLSDCYECRTE